MKRMFILVVTSALLVVTRTLLGRSASLLVTSALLVVTRTLRTEHRYKDILDVHPRPKHPIHHWHLLASSMHGRPNLAVGAPRCPGTSGW